MLNKKLIDLRGKKTVEEVSSAINVSPGAYMAFERGEREPKPLVKKLIADYFGKAEEEIFE